MTTLTRPCISLRLGGSLLEITIAIGLLAIFASTLFVMIGSQLLSGAGSHQSLEAVSLAHEGLEAVRSIRDRGWSSLTTGTHGLISTSTTWNFQGASDTTSGFTRSVTITDLSTNERQVISTVSWLSPTQQPRAISLATNVSNWRNVSTPLLEGNWQNPQTLSTFDLGPGNQATGVAVQNGTIYMTGIASASGKPDFFTINAQDVNNPTLTSSLDTGPGLHALTVNGDFAYVANSDVTQQLQILNISSPSSPYIVNTFRLTGNNAQAVSVHASGALVLVGTRSDAGPELYLIDTSNPSSPLIKSTLEVGGDVHRIFMLNHRAYLATSSSTHEFIVVNIANPSSPSITAYQDLPGANAALGLYINMQDDRAYITRQAAEGTSPEINVYNVATPDAPAFLGTMEYGNDIQTVFVADDLMFVGTANSNLEFQLYNVANLQNIGYYSGLNFPQVANDIAFENNIIYVAVRSNDALRIITSQ